MSSSLHLAEPHFHWVASAAEQIGGDPAGSALGCAGEGHVRVTSQRLRSF